MKRDLRFDSLRGLMLILMTLNHIPVSLSFLTDKPVGLLSGAEGFVFISGLICGLVYARAYHSSGLLSFRSRVWKRAGYIYLAHIICVLFYVALFNLSPAHAARWSENGALLFERPALGLLLSCSMLYLPGDLDILPMYVVFYLITPLTIAALCQGKWKTVLAWSLGLWLATQVFFAAIGFGLLGLEKDFLENLKPFNLGTFVLPAWQFLFIAGLMVGSYAARNKSWRLPINKSLFFAAASGALFFILLRYREALVYAGLLADGGLLLHGLNFLWAAKGNLFFGPITAANAAVLGYLFAVVGVRAGHLYHWPAIAILGRYSLQVFVFHVLIRLSLSPFEGKISMIEGFSGLLVSLLLVASLWIPPLLLKGFIRDKAPHSEPHMASCNKELSSPQLKAA